MIRLNRPLPLGIALAALLLAAGAEAGELRARLRLPSTLARALTPSPPKAYWEEWNGVLDPAPPPFDAGRHLAVALRGPGSGPPRGCEAAIRGGDLYPKTVLARAGGQVRITNTDGTPHELFAEGLEGFGPLPTAPGNARTVKVPSAGSWPLADRRYPHVGGHLVALADLVACGRVDRQGAVRFEDVPAGAYTLVVFRGGEAVATRKVEVPESGVLQLPEPIEVPAP